MIHVKENFYNDLVIKLDSSYYPTVKYYRDNEKCAKMHYIVELFNNGTLTYKDLINKLAKNCNDKNINLHNIVSEFITSFGTYRPIFKK